MTSLQLARKARKEENIKSAKMHYGKLYEEDDTDAEALFYYHYYAVLDAMDDTDSFIDCLRTFYQKLLSFPSVFANDGRIDDENRLGLYMDITQSLLPLPMTAYRFLKGKIKKSGLRGIYLANAQALDKFALGIDIAFQNFEQAVYLPMQIATIDIMKESIRLRRQWYIWGVLLKNNENMFVYFIKQHDESYVVPKPTWFIKE